MPPTLRQVSEPPPPVSIRNEYTAMLSEPAEEPSAVGLDFPEMIPLKVLRKVHPAYDRMKLEKCRDLYEGGDGFKNRVERYLVKRQLEEASASPLPMANTSIENASGGNLRGNVGGGQSQFAARKKIAWYTPHLAGIVDWIAAAALQAEPALISKDDYWTSLNDDADGLGTDLAAFAREAMLQTLIGCRAWLAVVFPAAQPAVTLAAQKAAGAFDARLSLLLPEEVDDWQTDAGGKHTMIRVHRSVLARSASWLPADTIVESWVYLTADRIVKYEVAYKENKPPKENSRVQKVEDKPHGLNGLPAVPIQIPNYLWVVERLSPLALNLFNRETSLTWALNQMAYALLVLKLQDPGRITQVVASETSGLKLITGEDASFVSPPTDIFDKLSSDTKRLKEDMYAALQAMALLASQKDFRDAPSGVAKFRDFGALATLLSCFAAALRDALEAALQLIADVRETEVPELDGLNKFDVQSTEFKVNVTDSFLRIPGIPESAKRWAVQSVSLAVCADAPADVRADITNESKQPKKEQAPLAAELGGGQAPAAGGEVSGDAVGKVPLALQQLALAQERAKSNGETGVAASIGQKMQELLKTI